MRKILMSRPGEFVVKSKSDFVRGAAVRMLASAISRSERQNNTDRNDSSVSTISSVKRIEKTT